MLKRIAAAMLALAITASAWAGPAEDKALWDAASVLNIEAVRAALKKGADPNAPSNTMRRITPLNATATMGSWRLTRDRANNATAVKLSQGGLSDDEIDKYLNVEITKLLFAAGAKLGFYDKSILFTPIAHGNIELVGLLIDNGASVTGDLEGYTPTELAKKYGQEAVYELLISRGGIPVDSRSSAQLALVEAASNSDVEGMERAFKDGARINEPDAHNQTALVAAVAHYYEPRGTMAIWWLLDHGADPNVEGEGGEFPLHMFAIASTDVVKRPDLKPRFEEMLARLLKGGAKVSATDKLGRTPLHIAARVDNVWMAEVLIREGAKVMRRDNTGKTPLDYAESSAMIRLLKQNGATER
jgi:ankyrin repeat protein